MVAAARARRQRPEQQIQCAVFLHLRQRGVPGVFAFHPANGGYRTATEAAIFKALGVVAGVSDVIVIRDGRTYALELKAEGGRLSDSQRATHAAHDRGRCRRRRRRRNRPGARLARRAPPAAREGVMTGVLKIEHAVTSNAPPFDQPWPPALMDGWVLVRAIGEGKTLWRRVSLAVEESANTSNDNDN
jgi:hypothetical protein